MKVPFWASSLFGLIIGCAIGLAIEYSANGFPDSSAESQVSSYRDEVLATGRRESVNQSEKPPLDSPITPAEIEGELRALAGGLPAFLTTDQLEEVVGLQERILSADVAGLATEVCRAEIPSPEICHLVMSAYAEKDPAAAWALANEAENNGTRSDARFAVLSSVVAKDPAQAFAWIEQLQEEGQRRELRSSILTSLAGQDPVAAWKHYQRLESDLRDNSGDLRANIFRRWMDRDPAAARSAAARLRGKQAAPAHMGVVNSLILDDPREAWNYAVSLPSDARLVMIDPLPVAAKAWARLEPQSAVQAAMALQTTGADRAVCAAMVEWADSDLDKALQFTVNLQNPTLRTDILRELSSSAYRDPGSMLPVVLKHVSDSGQLRTAVSGIFENWAARAPAEAAAALEQLPQGPVYQQAVAQVAARWIMAAPDKNVVLEWLQKLPPGEARVKACNDTFTTWSLLDSAGALAALLTLQGAEKEQAALAVAASWSKQDPEAVIRWSGFFENFEQRKQVIRDAFSEWVKNSPDSASRYWKTMKPDLQEATLPPLIQAWSGRDTLAAANWLRVQPASPAKDEAIISVATQIARDDPPGAIRWASTISDESQRFIQMERLAWTWIKWDPTKARAWIANSNWPQQFRDKFRGP